MSDTATRPDPVATLLSKIATFLASLDEDERELLEQGPPEDHSEVVAFDATIPEPNLLWLSMSNVFKGKHETVKHTIGNAR